jgi:diguanylate cyclase (GGDEF)-like protein
MGNDNLEILNICLAADSKALLIYSKFAELSKKRDLKSFWKKMSASEEGHCGYWRKLIKLAKDNALPQLFEQPFKTKHEMHELQEKVEEMLVQSQKIKDTNYMFLLAYRLEFYLLHPAFMTFLHFLESLPGQESPVDEYHNHLGSFIDALNKYGLEKPELKLLGETIARLWRDNSTLAVISSMDTLTGIYNRRGLFDALLPLIYLAQRKKLGIGVMIVDLDNFKKVNDKHGHQEGDKVLVWAADMLKSHIRVSDVIGRYGGEEFLIYFSDVNTSFLQNIAEKLRKLIETESRKKIPITASIGVAGGLLGENIEEDLQSMIKKADENLYKAKTAGKNKVAINGKK